MCAKSKMDSRRLYFKMRGARLKAEQGDDTDYSKGKIYMVNSIGDIPPYYGYTTQSLRDRMLDHEHNMESGKPDCCSIHIRAGGVIELVENYPCESREDLKARLEWYLKHFPNCVRRVSAKKRNARH